MRMQSFEILFANTYRKITGGYLGTHRFMFATAACVTQHALDLDLPPGKSQESKDYIYVYY